MKKLAQKEMNLVNGGMNKNELALHMVKDSTSEVPVTQEIVKIGQTMTMVL